MNHFTLIISDFMKFTPLRLLLISLFIIAIVQYSSAKKEEYLAAQEVPPSYRHMDELFLEHIIDDTLAAKKVDGSTLLILGDCVAFGHGVIRPFSSYLSVPNYDILNISMQTFAFALMESTIQKAADLGVKNVVIQLHPFTDFKAEADRWSRAYIPHSEEADVLLNGTSFAEVAKQNWKNYTTVRNIYRKGKNGLYFDKYQWLQMSSILRYEILRHIPLYRDRFIIDDMALKRSTFSKRQNRIDSYTKPLPEHRQIEILVKKARFFENFKINNPNEYMETLHQISAPARMAAILESNGMRGIFVLAPTFVEKMVENTGIQHEDFNIMRQMIKKSVESRGSIFIDFLEDEELSKNMRHFDNITVLGHKILARKLNPILKELLKNV